MAPHPDTLACKSPNPDNVLAPPTLEPSPETNGRTSNAFYLKALSHMLFASRDRAQTDATKEGPQQMPGPLSRSDVDQDAAKDRPIRSACSVAPPKTNSKRLAVVK